MMSGESMTRGVVEQPAYGIVQTRGAVIDIAQVQTKVTGREGWAGGAAGGGAVPPCVPLPAPEGGRCVVGGCAGFCPAQGATSQKSRVASR